MTKVRVTEAFNYGGKPLESGKVVDFPDGVAEEVIEKGFGKEPDDGEEITEVENPDGLEAETPEQLEETEDGVDVNRYATPSKFLTTDDVEKGDEMTIKGAGWTDDQFNREYLILPVEVNGEEYRWRVNKTNARKFKNNFGSDTGDWVGETAVITIEDYEGLDKEGIVVEVDGED